MLFEGCNATYTDVEHDASMDALVSRIPYIGGTVLPPVPHAGASKQTRQTRHFLQRASFLSGKPMKASCVDVAGENASERTRPWTRWLPVGIGPC